MYNLCALIPVKFVPLAFYKAIYSSCYVPLVSGLERTFHDMLAIKRMCVV